MARLLHQRAKPTLRERLTLWAARKRNEPHRITTIYAKLRQLGNWSRDNRPLVKPTPTNLRVFSRTVYATRAISLYTRAISGLDWHIVPREGVKNNSEIDRQIEVTTNCFNSPNHDDSLQTMVQQIVEDVCVSGVGVLEQALGGDINRPVWLWPVDALSIQIYANWNGEPDKPRYCQTMGYGNVGVTQGRDLLNRQIVYMRDRPTTDTPFSFGALEVAFESINRLLGTAEYAGNTAANANPANLLFIKGASSDEIEGFRTYWRNEIEGQGNMPILGGEDVSTEALRGATDDALYLKYQQFLIREIATAFSISPQNLGVEADVNRNTSEVADDRDWDLGITPMARMIASHLNREVIWGTLGFSQIELEPGGLERVDEEATAKIYAIEYAGNSITPNEHRARRNLPPLDTPYGDMVKAQVDIAVAAAKGAAQVNSKIINEE